SLQSDSRDRQSARPTPAPVNAQRPSIGCQWPQKHQPAAEEIVLGAAASDQRRRCLRCVPGGPGHCTDGPGDAAFDLWPLLQL
ncbi:hypothetical protein LPJ57_006256, partial [Coemansia sp. RSA 486]